MAQGNLILGTMRGKLGDIVAYNYNGKQAARVRRRQIANPKSSKQAVQRAIATTVAKFVSAFAPVLNNSIQSEGSKVSTLAKIRSLNMNMLRQLAAQGEGTFTPKGSMYVAPNNYLISRGTLAGITPDKEFSLEILLSRGAIAFDISQVNVQGTTASAVFPSIAVGDQITVLASYTEDVAEGSYSAYCRFAFKDNTTPALLTDGNYQKLNPAAIDLTKADGDWQSLRFLVDSLPGAPACSLMFVGAMLGEIIDSALPNAFVGVIVSREAGKLRSNAYMVSAPNLEYSLNAVYPTYMAGGTTIDMPSEEYLNNDAGVSDSAAVSIQLKNTSSQPIVLPLSFSFSDTMRSCAQLVGSDIPSFYQIRLTYTQNGTVKTATFYSNTSTKVDGVNWFISDGNWISAQNTAAAEITVSVTSVKYSDQDGNVIIWD